MRAVLFLIMAAIIATIIYFMSDELNRAGVLGSEGFIDSGSKFGVRIGMSKGAAENKLRSHGLKLVEPARSGRCLSRSYPADQKVDLWYDDNFGGTICLASQDGEIVSISWSYGSWQW